MSRKGLFLSGLIITHIFWDTFMKHGDKPSCIEEAACDLYFGNLLYKHLQKLVGNDKLSGGDVVKMSLFSGKMSLFWLEKLVFDQVSFI